MTAKSPRMASVLCGMLWAGLAVLLGASAFGRLVWGGILVAPLTGLAAGVASRRFGNLRPLARALFALGSLYVGATLFGLGVGMFDLVTGTNSGPNWHRIPSAVLIQSIVVTLAGLTLTGYVLFLWPLAYVNHWFIFHVWRESEDDSRESV